MTLRVCIVLLGSICLAAAGWIHQPTGQAPETVDLQQLIDAANGSVHIPAGTHVLERTLTIDLDQVGPMSITGNGDCTLVMKGSGPAIRFVGTHAGTANPSSVEDRVWERQRAPMVAGIEIVGDHPEADGIEADGTMQLTVSQVVIRKARHGIHLVNRNRNVIVSDCHIYENSGIGIYYDDVNLHQSNIGDCHISYNREGGVVVRGGDVRNVHIGNCDIEGNMADDGIETANVLFDSRGGSMAEAAITGCTIQHDHRAPGSANIRVIGESVARDFTDELRHGHITIQGNVLSDVQINVDLQQTRGVTVVGNTMWKGYTHDIAVSESASVVIGTNVFDRNPRYYYSDGKDANSGIVLDQVDGATIVGNHFKGVGEISSVIDARNSEFVHINGCSILDFPAHAISLMNCESCKVESCLLSPSEGNDTLEERWVIDDREE